MEEKQTFISLEEIRNFFEEECMSLDKPFSEEEFKKFLIICENDFFQWLNDNLDYYYSENESE